MYKKNILKIRLSTIVTIFAITTILFSCIKDFEHVKNGYILTVNIVSMGCALIYLTLVLLSIFFRWDILYVFHKTKFDLNKLSIAEKRDLLVNHIKSFSSWTGSTQAEKELNEMLDVCISKINNSIAAAEDALENYNQKKS